MTNSLQPRPPNIEGATQCIVRWMVETEKGWLGAWEPGAFDGFVEGRLAEELQRIKSALLAMHERDKARHNYFLCAVREIFGDDA